LQALLTSRFLVYTGTISYGIYLLEKIPLDFVKTFDLGKHAILAFPITAAATYAIAALSWIVLERRFLRLKRFFETKAVHPDSASGELLGVAEG
jgi:peptidoglycan/LPS O-acetylase OafA/YrhL